MVCIYSVHLSLITYLILVPVFISQSFPWLAETRVFDKIGIATKKSKKTWEYLGVVVITTVNLHLLKPELSFKMVRTTS